MGLLSAATQSPKKKLDSRLYDPTESAPWTAFLVPSVPNLALIELGDSYYAFYVLVGPHTCLHLFTASSETNSIPIDTSDIM